MDQSSFSLANTEVEVSYLLSATMQGKGLAKEAVLALFKWAKDN